MTWNPLNRYKPVEPTGDPAKDRYLDPQPGDHLCGAFFTWHLFVVARDETGLYVEVHFPTKPCADDPGKSYDPDPKRLRFQTLEDFIDYYKVDPPWGTAENEPSPRCLKLIEEWKARGDMQTMPFELGEKVIKGRCQRNPEMRVIYDAGFVAGSAKALTPYKYQLQQLKTLAASLPEVS